MTELFLIETKNYYVDVRHQEHQVADGGILPRIYLNADEAIKSARAVSNTYCEIMGYKVVTSNIEHPARKGECLFAERLYNELNEIRLEIRVYKTYTID